MNVTDIKSRTEKTYTLTVEGGELRPVPYSQQGKQYRIERIEVIKRDGNVSRVVLSGPVLKKDGTDSQLGNNEKLYRNGDWPDWLYGIIKGLA